MESQFDGEIAYVDSELSRFFEKLRGRGLYDDSIIIVTSDHGEFLGEQGLGDHQVGLVASRTQEWLGGRFGSDQVALIEGRYKLVVSEDGRTQLYDLLEDPGEARNVWSPDVEAAHRLRSELASWQASVMVKSVKPDAVPDLDEETLRRHEALGYID